MVNFWKNILSFTLAATVVFGLFILAKTAWKFDFSMTTQETIIRLEFIAFLTLVCAFILHEAKNLIQFFLNTIRGIVNTKQLKFNLKDVRWIILPVLVSIGLIWAFDYYVRTMPPLRFPPS